ncbi:MAG: BON domain-containing protein [Terasakiella sp.]|uniref:BON domain-containing protein n=1 Tax=unclassified Terasakiella TaxID=2614952 RepID=UPI003AFF817C
MIKCLGYLFGIWMVLLANSDIADAMEPADQRIYQQITREIDKTFQNSQADLQVAVKDAIVTINGYVDTGAQKYVLEMIVRRNSDVRNFNNQIRIRGVKEKTDYTWD